ncbi:MFS polyamine transporter [Dentipellis sp. KUC8613]|nr:MFS polyamine transporter [Dentipellis sp. KUC8613]
METQTEQTSTTGTPEKTTTSAAGDKNPEAGRPSAEDTETAADQDLRRDSIAKERFVETSLTSKDSNILIVDWDGPDDPANPRNWTFRQKWGATAIVSAFTFISPVVSSTMAPASEQIAHDFGVTSTVVIAMMTSIFVLAFAFGPLLLSPLSEIYGRSRVLQLANLWFLAWNIGCSFAKNTTELIVFRFLAGLGGSAPLSVSGGVIADMFDAEKRGQALALYTLAPLIGPVIGPIVGAWIAELSRWQWVFWATSIADGCVQVLGVLFLRETFAPVLLERKAKRIIAQMDQETRDRTVVRTIYEDGTRDWRRILIKSLIRPVQLFVTEPIVQLFGVYMAFVYGLLYLFITTLPSIFQGSYHESIGIAGLHYLALGIGLFAGTQIGARVLDRSYKSMSKRNGGVGKPEFRLPTMYPGTVLLPVGLLITGWTAQNRVFWIAPDIGIVLVGAGVVLNMLSLQTYVIDAFTLYSASALAATTFLRCIAGFGFPLFAPAMFSALGFGKGDTILAAFAIAIAPVPYLFWLHGERIRGMSRHAHKN